MIMNLHFKGKPNIQSPHLAVLYAWHWRNVYVNYTSIKKLKRNIKRDLSEIPALGGSETKHVNKVTYIREN